MKCVLRVSIQLVSVTFHIVRSTQTDIIKMYIGLRVKYTLLLCDFNVA